MSFGIIGLGAMFDKWGLTTCRTERFSREFGEFLTGLGAFWRGQNQGFWFVCTSSSTEGLPAQSTNEHCVLLVEQWVHEEGKD
jgi:hypothetical protein